MRGFYVKIAANNTYLTNEYQPKSGFILSSQKLTNLMRYLIIWVIALFLMVGCSSDDDGNQTVVTSSAAWLFATNHNGEVKKFNINNGLSSVFKLQSSDAEGIYYDAQNDGFTIVSRIPGRLESYYNIEDYADGVDVDLEAQILGNIHYQSGRDLAVDGDIYVVADDTDLDLDDTTPEGRLFVYLKEDNAFKLRNVVTTRFKLWGLEFIGGDLYAAVDETNKVAVYKNFASTYTTNIQATANKQVAFQGLLRIHGMDFEDNVMVLSDIGEAESSSDGGIHVIEDFVEKFNSSQNGFVALEEQLRISGDNTLLGNPVNVVYDSAYNVIFVAEALNNGGKVLAFNDATSVSGNISPDLQYDMPGVSSVCFYTE